jgi:D-alanyl-lipoteichoic acid acyltransferase DltB (MBOAT superfamily)
MLFNSYPFIFVFLPVTLFVFFAIGRFSQRFASSWLVVASIFFYGWWNPVYIPLLISSILFNYLIGLGIVRAKKNKAKNSFCRTLLITGLIIDLSLLGYFKYANFFLENVNVLVGTNWNMSNIILPLGISFFTFTQIAFLVDAYRGEIQDYNLTHYALFITYFPHLIAGPILHHKEIIPQFSDPSIYKPNLSHIAVGITVFFIGLFKKTVLADGIAPYAVTLFGFVAKGQELTFFEAWLGGICYIFQLYFDFSGYSDMAIGGSLLFGIKLPLNFHSPYKAVNIFEFWRRWHMTLSRFLRDYVYTPLSQGRQKSWRLMLNLSITMLIGGLWHGAGWNYLIWGGLHGIYLTINHIWRNIRRSLGHDIRQSTWIGRFLGCALTVAAFIFSIAFFRTQDLNGAILMTRGMLGLNGVALPVEWLNLLGPLQPLFSALGISFNSLNSRVSDTGFNMNAIKLALYHAFLIWFMPNTQQIMGKYFPALNSYRGDKHTTTKIIWEPTLVWSVSVAAMALIGLVYITKASEFLYYQF